MGCLRDGLDLGNGGGQSGLGVVQAFLPGENGLEIDLVLRDRFRRCIAAVSVRRNTWSIQINLCISIALNLGKDSTHPQDANFPREIPTISPLS
jgi:hypothetical protein